MSQYSTPESDSSNAEFKEYERRAELANAIARVQDAESPAETDVVSQQDVARGDQHGFYPIPLRKYAAEVARRESGIVQVEALLALSEQHGLGFTSEELLALIREYYTLPTEMKRHLMWKYVLARGLTFTRRERLPHTPFVTFLIEPMERIDRNLADVILYQGRGL